MRAYCWVPGDPCQDARFEVVVDSSADARRGSGLRAAAPLLVSTVNSCSDRSRICRPIAAGFRSAYRSARPASHSSVTAWWPVSPDHRRPRPVVGLLHLRALADLGHQLLLRVEEVRHQRLQHPDLVQQHQLRRRVVTQIPDDGADHCPVLALDMRSVVGVPRPGPGERQLLLLTPPQQMPVDELAAVVRVHSQQRERQRHLDVDKRSQHPSALFCTVLFSVHPVAISVTVNV